MVVVFKDDKGKNTCRFMSKYLRKNLDTVKYSVLQRKFGYISIIAGFPGTGKSTLGQYVCKYLDSTFTTKNRICFNAEDFIQRTSNAKKGTSWLLDESFENFNTRITRSSEYTRVINHLQLLRQKNLFIILCLPNFFDLSKGVAVFLSSHLFVTFHKDYHRGFFGAFGKTEKRMLYIKGSKFLNYSAAEPNFRATFPKKWIADMKLYEKLKLAHLQSQYLFKPEDKIHRDTIIRNRLIKNMNEQGVAITQIAKDCGVTRDTIYSALKSNET